MASHTVISLEQAVALPYATLRLAHLGWRVIRIEPTPHPSGGPPGDPNRYAGKQFADEGRRSFFVPPNVCKEAIAINLKSGEGKTLLKHLIGTLHTDVFCCNVLPARYDELGIAYETLRASRHDLIWAGISAMGPEYPDVPGYDPIIQAMSGLMSMTGFPDGPPTMTGVQITDLKAGDELYANVLLALLERAETGCGKRIDISMLQAAASWLVTVLPNVDLGCSEADISRAGNFHRVFVPTGVYEASDGFVYIAIGNFGQWRALTGLGPFRHLAAEARWNSLASRAEDSDKVRSALAESIAPLRLEELLALLASAGVPHTRINDIRAVHELPAVRSRMPVTVDPDGREIRLQPPAVDLPGLSERMSYAPRYGEHTDAVLAEAGLDSGEIARLRQAGIVA